MELSGERLKGGGKGWLLIKKSDSHADPAWKLREALTPEKRRGLRIKIPPCETS